MRARVVECQVELDELVFRAVNCYVFFDLTPVDVLVFVHGALAVLEQFLEVVAVYFEGDGLFFDTAVDGEVKPHPVGGFLGFAHVVWGRYY